LQNARDMTRALLCLLLFASPLVAQDATVPVLLRNVSGTAATPGDANPHITSGDGPWTFFYSGDAHVTYVSETGPEVQRNEVFSTNWLTAGLHRSFGNRAEFLVRGRVSLEPFTIDEGYPQLLQYVSERDGGPLVDRMRPHDLLGEAAAQFSFRIAGQTHFQIYAGLVGDPALGPAPFELRASSREFAEAPFAYEVQETSHDSTRVVTATIASRWLTLEASKFHDAVTYGDHTEIADDEFDSQSARLTLRPTQNLELQISRGELGKGLARRDVTSASLSWGTPRAALTAIYTSRDDEFGDLSQTAIGLEATFRFSRNTLMARVETVDRPAGFPVLGQVSPDTEETSHFAVGYIFDILTSARFRTGIGVNIDYHTQTHDLPAYYGHKPQDVFAFVRVRTK
jgi:hypothetical protein